MGRSAFLNRRVKSATVHSLHRVIAVKYPMISTEFSQGSFVRWDDGEPLDQFGLALNSSGYVVKPCDTAFGITRSWTDQNF